MLRMTFIVECHLHLIYSHTLVSTDLHTWFPRIKSVVLTHNGTIADTKVPPVLIALVHISSVPRKSSSRRI